MQEQNFDPDDFPSLDIALKEAKEAVEEQIQEVDAIDDKVGTILGFTGIIFSVLVGSSFRTIFSWYNTPTWSLLLLLWAIFLIISSVGLDVWAYRLKDYSAGPDPENILNEYTRRDTNWVKAKLIAIYVKAYEDNEGLVKEKTKGLRWATYCLFLGLFLIAIRYSCTITMRWM